MKAAGKVTTGAGAKRRWIGTWLGGRKALGKDGKIIFWIEKQVEGTRHRVRLLGVRTEPEANDEYDRWIANPDRYVQRPVREEQARQEAADEQRVVDASAVLLTPELIADFMGALEHGYGSRKPTSVEHRRHVFRCLADWATALHGRDLRTVSLAELREQLDAWGKEAEEKQAAREAARMAKAKAEGRRVAKPAKKGKVGDTPAGAKHRIASIKTMAAWLRWAGKLKRTEDPTIDLQCVQARRPSLEEKAAKVYTAEELERTYRHIANPDVRAIYLVKVHTGLHETELQRIARGDCDIREVKGQGDIAAVIDFTHKGKHIHRLSVDKQTLAAIRHLQALSTWPIRHTQIRNRRKAARLANEERLRECGGKLPQGERPIPEVHLGNIRHARTTIAEHAGQVVYPAQQQGVPLEIIARSHGHAPGTAAKFYSAVSIPPMVVVPVNLQHPED